MRAYPRPLPFPKRNNSLAPPSHIWAAAAALPRIFFPCCYYTFIPVAYLMSLLIFPYIFYSKLAQPCGYGFLLPID